MKPFQFQKVADWNLTVPILFGFVWIWKYSAEHGKCSFSDRANFPQRVIILFVRYILMTVLCSNIQIIITYFPEVSTKDNECKWWHTSYMFMVKLGTTAWHRLITLTNAETFYQSFASVDDLNVRLIITPLLKYTSLFRKTPKYLLVYSEASNCFHYLPAIVYKTTKRAKYESL